MIAGMTTIPQYHSGDACPVAGCRGRLRIASTPPDRSGDGFRTRYFECKHCGKRCSCEVDAATIHRRNR